MGAVVTIEYQLLQMMKSKKNKKSISKVYTSSK